MNKTNNKKGQIAIVLLVVMTLMLSAASLYIFYLSNNDIAPKMQAPDSVFTLYKKAEIARLYVADTLKEAADTSKGDFAKCQTDFLSKYESGKTQLGSLLGEQTKILWPSVPIVEQGKDSIKVKLENVKIAYSDPDRGITLISYKFNIDEEESLLQPLGI